MAQKVQVILTDDKDGGQADETVIFGLDGASYEIDLNENNANALRDLLGPWVAVARRIKGKASGNARGGSSRTTAPDTRQDAAEVRRWAQENGYNVPPRGRIPNDVIEAFKTRTPAATQEATDAPETAQNVVPLGQPKPAKKTAAQRRADAEAAGMTVTIVLPARADLIAWGNGEGKTYLLEEGFTKAVPKNGKTPAAVETAYRKWFADQQKAAASV